MLFLWNEKGLSGFLYCWIFFQWECIIWGSYKYSVVFIHVTKCSQFYPCIKISIIFMKFKYKSLNIQFLNLTQIWYYLTSDRTTQYSLWIHWVTQTTLLKYSFCWDNFLLKQKIQYYCLYSKLIERYSTKIINQIILNDQSVKIKVRQFKIK